MPPSNVLPMWAIYERPLDYPDKYVVRRWDVKPGGAIPESSCLLADTLTEARDMLPRGLTRLARNPNDEQQIVETWL